MCVGLLWILLKFCMETKYIRLAHIHMVIENLCMISKNVFLKEVINKYKSRKRSKKDMEDNIYVIIQKRNA